MKEHTSATILIGRDAHEYLEAICREQRGCKPLSAEQKDRQWDRILKFKDTGMRQVYDDTYGGGDGTYWGKWWSWSVETIKTMLDEANLPYEESEPITWIDAGVHL